MASSETHWIWIQIGIALFLVALFLARGKNVGPTRLKLHRPKNGASNGGTGSKESARLNGNAVASHRDDALVPSRDLESQRPLNVLFNFNGETFDAFEVLGLPAASPWEIVQTTYTKNFSMKSHAERALYEFAYKAIESSYRGQRVSS